MAVSKRLRYEILRRDGHACRYCGAKAPGVVITVDHVVPVALGGADDPTNLVAACAACNSGKTSSSPDQPIIDNVAEDALRWARAVQFAGVLQMIDRQQVELLTTYLDEVWSGYGIGEAHSPVPRPPDWRQSVESFYKAGLNDEADVQILGDMVVVAMSKPRLNNDRVWNYFCGCVWKRIQERHDIARRLIDDGEVD